MKAKSLVVILAAAMAAGCASQGPEQQGERRTSKTAIGTGIGAVAGAAIGAMTSNKSGRGKAVLTGAAVGAAAGAGTGYVMDRQEQKMRERMANSGVQVKRDGDALNLTIPGNISFATGSSALTPNFYPVLDKVATTLAEYPDTNVQIVGHTDSTGTAAVNQELSRNRANAVALYLGQQGIAPARMQAQGVGATLPAFDNVTASGRAGNRRVEIKIVPLKAAASR